MQSSTANEGRRTLSRYRFSADRSTGGGHLEELILTGLEALNGLLVFQNLEPDFPQLGNLTHSVHMTSSLGLRYGLAWQHHILHASSSSAGWC